MDDNDVIYRKSRGYQAPGAIRIPPNSNLRSTSHFGRIREEREEDNMSFDLEANLPSGARTSTVGRIP
jgi:hypothetical protein